MKVCLFSESFLPQIGGKELVIHHLANSLCDIGCSVTVITKEAPGKLEVDKKYRLVRYWKLFPGSGRTGFDFITSVITIYRENKKDKFDIINCHGVGFDAGRVIFAKKFIKAPIIMTPHGNDLYTVPEINLGLRMNKRYDRIIKRNLKTCDAITAISNSFIDEISLITGNKVYLISNGINKKLFTNKKSDYLYKLLSLDPKHKIVLSVGRNVASKDYESGIHAFEILNKKDEGKNLVYCIIGKDSNKFEGLVNKLNLNKNVFLIPEQNQDNIIKSYQSAWCLLSTSIIEGLSLVNIEAMSTGLPLVLTEVPGNVDILNENKCGVFVKKGDPISMAHGILSIYSNDALYHELSHKALVQSEKYDWGNIAKMYLDVYRRVIDHTLNKKFRINNFALG